jgi:ABC-type multidrug transport system fused ATPase/permease subunit
MGRIRADRRPQQPHGARQGAAAVPGRIAGRICGAPGDAGGGQRIPGGKRSTPRGRGLPGDCPHYIEFRHVYKTFDKPVLVDSQFYVDAGETVAIIGRSGVGKSVTLGAHHGFPEAGPRAQVIVAHEDITDFDEAE